MISANTNINLSSFPGFNEICIAKNHLLGVNRPSTAPLRLSSRKVLNLDSAEVLWYGDISRRVRFR